MSSLILCWSNPKIFIIMYFINKLLSLLLKFILTNLFCQIAFWGDISQTISPFHYQSTISPYSISNMKHDCFSILQLLIIDTCAQIVLTNFPLSCSITYIFSRMHGLPFFFQSCISIVCCQRSNCINISFWTVSLFHYQRRTPFSNNNKYKKI